MIKRIIPGILGRAGKDVIRGVIPDALRRLLFDSILGTTLNPVMQVPNGGWGENKNLTFSVLSPPVVNETAMYLNVRLDENGLPPFADLQDLTLPPKLTTDDFLDQSYFWDCDSPSSDNIEYEFEGLAVSGKKVDVEDMGLDNDDSLVDEILRISRGPR